MEVWAGNGIWGSGTRIRKKGSERRDDGLHGMISGLDCMCFLCMSQKRLHD